MSKIIHFPDGFTSATEPTTGGAIASFAEVFANDAACEAVYSAGASGSFYFNSTFAPAALNFFFISSASSFFTPSLTV